MAIEKDGELLCLPGSGKTYLVEFDYVVELCTDLKISQVPCLTERFLGLVNYKGSIIPVVRLEDGLEESRERNLILVVTFQKYQMGILLPRAPYSIPCAELETIRNSAETLSAGGWSEKGIYRAGGVLVSLLDVERSLGELILFP